MEPKSGRTVHTAGKRSQEKWKKPTHRQFCRRTATAVTQALLSSHHCPFRCLKVKAKITQSCHVSLRPHRLYSPWNSLGQNTGVGSRPLLQGFFPTQGSNPGLPRCRHILYQLSRQGSPRILEWVAYPFSQGSNWGLLHCRQILYHLSQQEEKGMINDEMVGWHLRLKGHEFE